MRLTEGTGVTLNGNGHKLDGQGAQYWDGQGTNGGVTKPHPFVKSVFSIQVLVLIIKHSDSFRVKISGTLENLTVLNSPAQAISLGNSAALLITGVTVDNSAGDSGALGHNTDVRNMFSSSISLSILLNLSYP